jgi:hypothetical protein
VYARVASLTSILSLFARSVSLSNSVDKRTLSVVTLSTISSNSSRVRSSCDLVGDPNAMMPLPIAYLYYRLAGAQSKAIGVANSDNS